MSWWLVPTTTGTRPLTRFHDRFHDEMALVNREFSRFAQHAQDSQAMRAFAKLELDQMAQTGNINLPAARQMASPKY